MNEISIEKYFTRQTRLPEVGHTGQNMLQNTHILVIGAGGLGCPFLNYVCAAGVGFITLYDFDTIDFTNLHRQTLYSPDEVGKNKAITAKQKLEQQYPYTKINAIAKKFLPPTTADLDPLSCFDIVIDCTDNFETKFLLHDLCFQYHKKFLMASIHKFEGILQYFDFGQKKEDHACLRCLYPERPTNDCVETCAEAGIIGAVAGILGTIQALEMIKIILNISPLLSAATLLFDLTNYKQTTLRVFKNRDCPLNTSNPTPYKDSIHEFEISSTTFHQNKNTTIIINLSNYDLNLNFEKKISLPEINQLLSTASPLPFTKNEKIFIVCHKGISSLKLTKELRTRGHNAAYSLASGLDAL